MAILKLGSVVTEMHGKLGGSYLQMKGSRLIASANLSHLRNPSTIQNQTRANFQLLGKIWTGYPDNYRKQWNSAAGHYFNFSKNSDNYKLTGRELFFQINIARYALGVQEYTLPPSFTAEPADIIIDWQISGNGNNMYMTPSRTTNTYEYMYIFATQRFSASIHNPNKGFRYLFFRSFGNLNPSNIAPIYNGVWNLKAIAKTAVIFRCYTMNVITGSVSSVQYYRVIAT